MPNSKTSATSTTDRTVRCPLCRKIFQTGDFDTMELQKHQGGSDCLKRRAEKGIATVLNAKTTNTQVSSTLSAPSQGEFTAVADAFGAWTQKCDRCESSVRLGNSCNRAAFEAHRHSGSCQDKRRALKARREVEKQSRLLSDYIKRTPSQAKSQQASSSKVKIDSTASLPKTQQQQGTTGTSGDPKPSDANLATLARDVLRALADVPTEKKRKNREDREYSKKKPKVLDY